MAPFDDERIGDVSNVLFCNGAIVDDNDDVFIYYAASDTRIHVATTTIEKLVDYTFNNPADPMRSLENAQQRKDLIDRKSTRLNSSHVAISYAVFCLKKKTKNT